MRSKLSRLLAELSDFLYQDRSHLVNTLSMAVDDCGCRLGAVDLGTKDFGNRVVGVFGSPTVFGVMVVWKMTEHGNLEADFQLFP